jgi:OmpA-OmpF porin, OOP family
MNKLIRSLTVAGAAALFATSAGQAQIMVDGYYVKADLGPSFMQSIHYKNAPGHIDVDPGIRGDLIFGVNFNRFLAGEFELGSLANSLDTSSGQISAIAYDANLYQVPILGNLIFKVPLGAGVTPYIGAGAGGVVSSLYLRTVGHYWAYDTDFNFAFQGMAGVDFAINPKMTVGVGYKFLGTLEQTWFGDNPALTVHADNLYSHTVLASFTFKF